ncbi:unnamed protein product [Caenorhabditis bovis]|uniref:Uncharacterized protein n=1 Tax=Caenorhabditis bovis TaxID=2654633 RepID=A0A8S1F9A9_9PELO|nr:unnamed protein product [Caenorhabditis bovis]
MTSRKRNIERISSSVAEKITTAQVVVSLGDALRQLVDNSIDANATIIDIRAKNHGFESLEVQDNGIGIDSCNFENLCKPHSTSKLSDFSDFDKLSTLGFRGEALNALCALSTVSIFTRSSTADLGTRLKFDHSGEIIERKNAARELGTTVTVENLFETLPVRRKELERTAKKDFIKMLTMVQSFALMCPQIRFLVTNTIAGGKRQNIICTPGGNSTVRDVVTNLFGFSGGKHEKLPLVDIKCEFPNEEIQVLHSIPKNELHIFDLIKIHGFVSSCEHGNGRSTSDRQFVYINNRPVDYSRVCSICNEVYKQFNKTQYPVVVLFIQVPADKIDVNMTPDKKTVMFEKERHLLALIRSSLMATFQPLLGAHSTIRSSVEDRRNSSFYSQASSSQSSPNVTLDDTLLNSTINSEADEPLPNVADLLKSRRCFAPCEPAAKRVCSAESGPKSKIITIPPSKNSQNATLESFSFTFTPYTKPEKPNEPSPRAPSPSPAAPERRFQPPLLRNLSKGFDNSSVKDDSILDVVEKCMENEDDDENEIEEVEQNPKNFVYMRPQQKIKFSMKTLRQKFEKLMEDEKSDEVDVDGEFSAPIDPEHNDEAEKQLDRALKKEDFKQMEVVGQFNKGFIICRLRSHLFIVDQHASDEKYNFERLQKSAKLTKQPLFTPTPLNFGAVQEMVIRENLHIFAANGFEFEFRENDGCIKTFMTARPEILSQNLTNADLDEIVAMVSEYPNQMFRPMKIRKIFASRACRKSIMIGTALNEREMTRVVKNLAGLDQPWNCPHGRPTIRHLSSMNSLNFE